MSWLAESYIPQLKFPLYWVFGQNIPCYRKTQTNILANPIPYIPLEELMKEYEILATFGKNLIKIISTL